MASLKIFQNFASIAFIFVVLFIVPDCNSKMLDEDQFYGGITSKPLSQNKSPKVWHSASNHITDKEVNDEPLIQPMFTTEETYYVQEHLIPDYNKVVIQVKLHKPMTEEEVIKEITTAAAKMLNLPVESVKVVEYENSSGFVKMFLKEQDLHGFENILPASVAVKHLAGKRFQSAMSSMEVISVIPAEDYRRTASQVYLQSVFGDKYEWETWQLVVTVCTCIFAMFTIFILIFFLSSRRVSGDKVAPMEEPRQVVVQPVLRPAVAGVDVIQPENRDLHIPNNRVVVADNRAADTHVADTHVAETHTVDTHVTETDSENTQSPSRSPMRIKGKGLLERRGSNASLTLDLNRSQENIHCGTPPKECSAEEFLMSASKRMSRKQLRNCLKDVKALHSEFWEIPMNHPEKVEVAGSGTKNRYKTILPNESSRVHLIENGDDPLTAYINANYIRGYAGEQNAYIATQGPMPHTINDFWHMIWKEKSPLVVMITKLKEKLKVKCEPYLPEHKGRFLDIEVTVIRVIPRDGYTIRELFLRRGNETHTVYHFWYTAWPDHKTPHTAKQMLAMALEVEGLRHDNSGATKGPMIVHCSAGIGRTGCFIAASIGIQQLLEENKIDVLAIVCSLRLDRGGMVQTAEQYEFVHQALSMFEGTLPGTSGE